MAAASTDKLKKLARRWVGQIGAAGVADASVTTIPLASTTNLPTDTAVVATIDRVDANGSATSSFEETVIGVVSGSNLTSCVRGVEGTAQSHAAGAVVEILVTAKGWNDLMDHLLVGHNQDGSHGSGIIVASNISSSAVSAGKIAASAVVAGNLAASAVLAGNLAASAIVAGNLSASSVDATANSFFTPSQAQGDILYRGASAWARLGAGTSGQFLKTQGAGQNPVWADSTYNTTARVRAYLSANQSINSATWTKLTLDTEDYDSGNNFDNATNYRFTAPVTGYYFVTGHVDMAAGTAGKRLIADLYLNGSQRSVLGNQQSTSTGGDVTANFSDVMKLTAGDYLELWCYHDQTGAQNAKGGKYDTYLAIHLLSI
jgi:hypothetical protein